MTSTSNPRMPSNGQHKNILIDDRYRLGVKLGAGNFGEIRIARDDHTLKLYAVKLEAANYNNRQLYLENKFYKSIHENGDIIGIPKVYYYGMVGKYYTLVMDLLGHSLEELFELCNNKFSVRTVCNIGIQAIRRLQTVHSHNIVYRDIKPENFLIGSTDDTVKTIFLVDFGLSKEYIDSETKRHIPYREHKSLTGTARYMSINTHMGIEQSRRDDLESLGHMFFYLLRGQLPWQGLKANSIKERYQKIGEVKRSTPIEVLCQNCPAEFGTYLKYSRQLDFYQEPDYDYLVGLFEKILSSPEHENENDYDWVHQKNFKIRRFGDNHFPRPSNEVPNYHQRTYTPNDSKFVDQPLRSNDADRNFISGFDNRKKSTTQPKTKSNNTKNKQSKKKISLNCCNK